MARVKAKNPAELESVIRGGLSRMAHDESLSDELIAPNLDQNISFFYDPSYEKAAETIREVSRRVTNSGGFLSRLGKDANRFAKTNRS